MYPEPRVEIHPRLAEQHGIVEKRLGHGDHAPVARSRSQASVVRTIRPDTVFIPYHWADKKSANLLTHRTLDPRSKIPGVQSLGVPHSQGGGPAVLGNGRRPREDCTARSVK